MIPSTRTKRFILLTVLSIVLIAVVIGGVIWIIWPTKKCPTIVKDPETNNTIINAVTKDILLNINNSLHRVEDSLHNKTTVNFTELFEKLKISIASLNYDLGKG